MKKFGVKSVVATAILAALVFVLLRFVQIPTPFPDTTLSIYAAVIGLFAVLFGPAVGFLGGFLGNLLVDLTAGWGVWWTWVVGTGVFGLIMGLGCKGINLDEGVFGKKEIIRFVIVSFIGAALTWLVVCPVGDVLVYKEPAKLVFIQGISIGTCNFVVTAVLGSALCLAYASSKAKKGSLSKDE